MPECATSPRPTSTRRSRSTPGTARSRPRWASWAREVDQAATVAAAQDIGQDPAVLGPALPGGRGGPGHPDPRRQPGEPHAAGLGGVRSHQPDRAAHPALRLRLRRRPGCAGPRHPGDRGHRPGHRRGRHRRGPHRRQTSTRRTSRPASTTARPRRWPKRPTPSPKTGSPSTPTAPPPSVTAETLGPWVTSRPGREALQLVLDREQVGEDLPGLLPDVGDPPAAASFTVEQRSPPHRPGPARHGLLRARLGPSGHRRPAQRRPIGGPRADPDPARARRRVGREPGHRRGDQPAGPGAVHRLRRRRLPHEHPPRLL